MMLTSCAVPDRLPVVYVIEARRRGRLRGWFRDEAADAVLYTTDAASAVTFSSRETADFVVARLALSAKSRFDLYVREHAFWPHGDTGAHRT